LIFSDLCFLKKEEIRLFGWFKTKYSQQQIDKLPIKLPNSIYEQSGKKNQNNSMGSQLKIPFESCDFFILRSSKES